MSCRLKEYDSHLNLVQERCDDTAILNVRAGETTICDDNSTTYTTRECAQISTQVLRNDADAVSGLSECAIELVAATYDLDPLAQGDDDYDLLQTQSDRLLDDLEKRTAAVLLKIEDLKFRGEKEREPEAEARVY